MKVILLALVALGILGVVGHMDYQAGLLEAASIKCQPAAGTYEFEQCVTNNIENNGDN